MALKLVTAPAAEPVTLAEIKEHLRVDSDLEDALISALITAARQWAETYQGRAYITQTWNFLVGSEEELSPIWDAYHLAPAVDAHSNGNDTHDNTGLGQAGGVQGLKQAIAERYLVIHSTPVYLIDREGDMRAVFTPPLEPEDLVHDIRVLLD